MAKTLHPSAELSGHEDVLRVDGVSVTYRRWGREQAALRGLRAAFRFRAVNVVIGPNGSGKSTLLKVIAGALEVEEGVVLVKGISLGDLPRLARSQMVGFLEQLPDANLCSGFRVSEMMQIYDVPVEARGALGDRLSDVGVHWRDKVRELSGGQKQLLAVELLLSRGPEVLLLDEPTASLDERNAWKVEARVREAAAAAGVCVVLVTHDLVMARRVGDLIWALRDGTVAEVLENAPGRGGAVELAALQALVGRA